MQIDGETLRFIFGFKLRGLRQEKSLSLKTLAQMTGLSPSYLNEIEKGKKYPKGDKILILAEALGVSYDELTSIQLKKELGIIAQILGNNLVRGLPFEVFGIPARTLFELMAEQPQNFSALVGTVLDLARNYNIKVEDFFHATLRAYLDLSNNYFPDLEQLAEATRMELGAAPLTSARLREHLTQRYGYKIEEIDFSTRSIALKNLHFYAIPGKPTRLLVNAQLSEREKGFVFAKELGYAVLKLSERITSNLSTQIDSFDALLGNFKAAYFSSALLIPRDDFVTQLSDFFSKPTWDSQFFLNWATSYPAPPSAFFHRLSQLLPGQMGLDQIFFLRFDYEPVQKKFNLLRELHLSELHAPHDSRNLGHYCRRWITTSLLEQQTAVRDSVQVGAQRSHFFGSTKEYLCFALAYGKELDPTRSECLTVGIRLGEELHAKIKFLEDPKIPRKIVADICERCGVEGCRERAAPPVDLEQSSSGDQIERALESLAKC